MLSYATKHIASGDTSKLDDLTAQIEEMQQQHDIVSQQRNTFSSICKTKIKNHGVMMEKFIFSSGHAPRDLDITEMKSKYENLDLIIFNLKSDIDLLMIERDGILSTIRKHSILCNVTCAICFQIAPLVTFKFPCCNVVNATGRPKCWMNVCITCVNHITGLSVSDPHHVTRCPTCRVVCKRVKCAADAYTLNMQLIATVDRYLADEARVYKEFSGKALNPVNCPQCDESFAGLSDLHHHIHSNTGFAPCQGSKIRCIDCTCFFERKSLSVSGKCNRCDTAPVLL